MSIELQDWDNKLCAAVWAYNITMKNSTGQTPFLLVYGHECVLLVEFELPSLRLALDEKLKKKNH